MTYSHHVVYHNYTDIKSRCLSDTSNYLRLGLYWNTGFMLQQLKQLHSVIHFV